MKKISHTEENSIIAFPCYFPIKIIGNNKEHFITEISALITSFTQGDNPPEFSIKTSENQSYVSITATIYVENQTILDTIYRAVTKHPDIKMVL